MGKHIQNYGVWVATLESFDAERSDRDSKSPHIQLTFEDGTGVDYNSAVNVKSLDSDSRLVYWFIRQFDNSFTNLLSQLEPGFHAINHGDDLALDYIRGGFVPIKQGLLLEHDVPGPNNDIIDALSPILQDAIDRRATIYIFGSQYKEHDGIHDVHMNQGSLPRFENGVGEDGGIFMYFDDDGHWEAVFLAFASQKIPTDSQGLPTAGSEELSQLVEGNVAN